MFLLSTNSRTWAIQIHRPKSPLLGLDVAQPPLASLSPFFVVSLFSYASPLSASLVLLGGVAPHMLRSRLNKRYRTSPCCNVVHDPLVPPSTLRGSC